MNMGLLQEIQQGEYYEVNILNLYRFVVPHGNGAVFGLVAGVLEGLGFDDRMMQMGENPLLEKTGDGERVLATLTRCKPDGQPFTTEEIRQRKQS